MSTDNDNEARALYEAAVHEAGHAIIAEQLTGAPASITIERRERDNAVWFKGSCTHQAGRTREDRLMIGLAGASAETRVTNPYATGPRLAAEIWRRVSAADADSAEGRRIDNSEVDAAVRLVWAAWPQIEARAQQEVERHRGKAAASSTPALRASIDGASIRSPQARTVLKERLKSFLDATEADGRDLTPEEDAWVSGHIGRLRAAALEGPHPVRTLGSALATPGVFSGQRA